MSNEDSNKKDKRSDIGSHTKGCQGLRSSNSLTPNTDDITLDKYTGSQNKSR